MAASSSENVLADLPEDIWMLRPCEIYKEEATDCSSWKGRFHQYYTEGCYKDCTKWQEDYKNCMKFRKTGDPAAVEAIIEHEKERREARLKAARGNDVWEYRSEPPEDWNRELPNWTKNREHTVLAQVQRERERGGTISQPEAPRLCTIS